MDIMNGIPDVGDVPPANAPIGHIWYSQITGHFYYKNEEGNWIATDQHDNVVDIILGEKDDTPEDAYDRAMSIL